MWPRAPVLAISLLIICIESAPPPASPSNEQDHNVASNIGLSSQPNNQLGQQYQNAVPNIGSASQATNPNGRQYQTLTPNNGSVLQNRNQFGKQYESIAPNVRPTFQPSNQFDKQYQNIAPNVGPTFQPSYQFDQQYQNVAPNLGSSSQLPNPSGQRQQFQTVAPNIGPEIGRAYQNAVSNNQVPVGANPNSENSTRVNSGYAGNGVPAQRINQLSSQALANQGSFQEAESTTGDANENEAVVKGTDSSDTTLLHVTSNPSIHQSLESSSNTSSNAKSPAQAISDSHKSQSFYPDKLDEQSSQTSQFAGEPVNGLGLKEQHSSYSSKETIMSKDYHQSSDPDGSQQDQKSNERVGGLSLTSSTQPDHLSPGQSKFENVKEGQTGEERVQNFDSFPNQYNQYGGGKRDETNDLDQERIDDEIGQTVDEGTENDMDGNQFVEEDDQLQLEEEQSADQGEQVKSAQDMEEEEERSSYYEAQQNVYGQQSPFYENEVYQNGEGASDPDVRVDPNNVWRSEDRDIRLNENNDLTKTTSAPFSNPSHEEEGGDGAFEFDNLHEYLTGPKGEDESGEFDKGEDQRSFVGTSPDVLQLDYREYNIEGDTDTGYDEGKLHASSQFSSHNDDVPATSTPRQSEGVEQGQKSDDWYDDPNDYEEDNRMYQYEDNDGSNRISSDNNQISEVYKGDQDILEEGVVDTDMLKKDKQPTAPSSMVLVYTWMILAVLIVVVSVSTYQTRCKILPTQVVSGSHSDDRKRLLEHEFA